MKKGVDRVLAIFRRREKAAVDLGQLPDEELMVRYREGSMRAFEVLLERHRQPVFNFLYRFVRSRSTAEDLLQEVFLRVVRNAHSYRPKARFTTWLYTIARNLAIDQTRKARHQRTLSLDQPIGNNEEGMSYLDMVPARGRPSDEQLVGRDFAISLYRALDAIPGEQREVFLLRQYHAMPFKEIAQVVGAPLNTVKSRMRYALEGLRLRLVEHHDTAHPAAELVLQ